MAFCTVSFDLPFRCSFPRSCRPSKAQWFSCPTSASCSHNPRVCLVRSDPRMIIFLLLACWCVPCLRSDCSSSIRGIGCAHRRWWCRNLDACPHGTRLGRLRRLGTRRFPCPASAPRWSHPWTWLLSARPQRSSPRSHWSSPCAPTSKFRCRSAWLSPAMRSSRTYSPFAAASSSKTSAASQIIRGMRFCWAE